MDDHGYTKWQAQGNQSDNTDLMQESDAFQDVHRLASSRAEVLWIIWIMQQTTGDSLW